MVINPTSLHETDSFWGFHTDLEHTKKKSERNTWKNIK